jgi:hypothetical protein
MEEKIIDIYTCHPNEYHIGYTDFIGSNIGKVISIEENTNKIGTNRDIFTHVVKFKIIEKL